jgi:hypothetical protein
MSKQLEIRFAINVSQAYHDPNLFVDGKHAVPSQANFPEPANWGMNFQRVDLLMPILLV